MEFTILPRYRTVVRNTLHISRSNLPTNKKDQETGSVKDVKRTGRPKSTISAEKIFGSSAGNWRNAKNCNEEKENLEMSPILRLRIYT